MHCKIYFKISDGSIESWLSYLFLGVDFNSILYKFALYAKITIDCHEHRFTESRIKPHKKY